MTKNADTYQQDWPDRFRINLEKAAEVFKDDPLTLELAQHLHAIDNDPEYNRQRNRPGVRARSPYEEPTIGEKIFGY